MENMNQENKGKRDGRGRVISDWIAAGLVVIGLIICYFLWGCRYDFPVTVIAVLVVALGTFCLQKQNKKVNELYRDDEMSNTGSINDDTTVI